MLVMIAHTHCQTPDCSWRLAARKRRYRHAAIGTAGHLAGAWPPSHSNKGWETPQRANRPLPVTLPRRRPPALLHAPEGGSAGAWLLPLDRFAPCRGAEAWALTLGTPEGGVAIGAWPTGSPTSIVSDPRGREG